MRSQRGIINHWKLIDNYRISDTRRVVASICPNVLLTRDVTCIKSILVCSAKAGDGAITVAEGLAPGASEQQTGPVLLMEGNFRQTGVLADLSKISTHGGDQAELGLNRRIFPIHQWIDKKL
ncbi:MAG: hypothetical protein Q7O12_06245 [Deltaproteobacteria bacterium]|nr:hypothetical protein [Deltaproteobacteria bacterium]